MDENRIETDNYNRGKKEFTVINRRHITRRHEPPSIYLRKIHRSLYVRVRSETTMCHGPEFYRGLLICLSNQSRG